MKNTPGKIVCATLLIASCFSHVALVSARPLQDKRQIIARAGRSYYNLRNLGLVDFHAALEPNWPVIVSGIESNPQALKTLHGLKFWMVLAADDRVKVDHQVMLPAPSDQLLASFKQISAGMDQIITGFFATWSFFMLRTPFPNVDSEYQLADEGNHYVISYKDGDANVTVRMNKSFEMTELSVVSPKFKSTTRPRFMKNDKGYILVGYSSHYEPNLGPGRTDLDLDLTYQEVKGLQLPLTLRAKSVYDGNPNQTEITFTEVQITLR